MKNALVTQGVRLNPYLANPGNVPRKDLHGQPKRPHRRLGMLKELRKRRSSEAPRLQNRNGCPRHSLGLRCVGIRPLLPKTGCGSACPSTKASGPPVVDTSNTIVVDVLGLPLAKVVGLRSPTSATPVALSSWPRTGRSGMTTSGITSTIPTSEATGGSAGESATAPAGVALTPAPATGQAGLGPRPRQQSPPAQWPPRQRGRPGGLAPRQLMPPGPPARGRFVRRPANRHGTPRCRLRRPASS
jgi:hypothetical protein